MKKLTPSGWKVRLAGIEPAAFRSGAVAPASLTFPARHRWSLPEYELAPLDRATFPADPCPSLGICDQTMTIRRRLILLQTKRLNFVEPVTEDHMVAAFV